MACGFGTVYEALNRVQVSGQDRVLVTGVGPVGMAAGLVAKAMGATMVIGVDISSSRLDFAQEVGAIDHGIAADAQALATIQELTQGRGVRSLRRLFGIAGRKASGAAGAHGVGVAALW